MSTYAIDPVTGLPRRGNTGSSSAASQGFTTGGPAGSGESGSLNLPTGGLSSPTTTPSITSPGYIPDYASLIANDPAYLQLQKDLGAQGVSDVASRNAAINRALIGFGQVPDMNAAGQSLGIQGLSDIVDPTTAALAQQNEFSTAKDLATAHTNAIRQIQQGLAARGGLRSGELGYQLGQEQHAYGQANNDATQKLLDYIGGVQSAFTTAQQQRQMQLDQGAYSAAQLEAQLHPASGSQTANYDASASVAFGFPVYTAPDGTRYRADGTPVSGSPPSLPAWATVAGQPSSMPRTPNSVSYTANPPAANYATNTGGLGGLRQNAGRGAVL